MAKKRKPVLGETLLAYHAGRTRDQDTVTEVEVSKVGRKYFETRYQSGGHTYSFGQFLVADWSIATWRSRAVSLLAESQEEVDRFVEAITLRNELYPVVSRYGFIDKLSLTQLRKLKELIQADD